MAIHDDIKKHFSTADPTLSQHLHLAEKAWELEEHTADEYFFRLCRTIAFQQLTGKAATTIFNRVLELFPDKKLTPEAVLATPHEKLRAAGLSNSKANYIRNIATAALNGDVDFLKLAGLEDEEIVSALTKIKGVGRWTAEMFLLFTLRRPDIFSFGDLGLIKGVQGIYGIKRTPSKKRLEKIVKKWSPYKSYASLLLWAYLDQ